MVRMVEYVVLECKDCKRKGLYINGRSDGKSCEVCGSGMYFPIDTGSKADMKFKYNLDKLVPIGIEPKRIHRTKRLIELSKAIERYIKAGLGIPEEWIEEYNELNEKYGKHIRI